MGLKLEAGKTYRSTKGEKIGPMIHHITTVFIINKGDGCVWKNDGSCFNRTTDAIYGDLIAEWPAEDAPTGPVRTVTRKEIQTGVYLDGTLIVSDAGFGRMQFAICTTDPESFDKAMNMLRDIREALEEQ